MLSLSRATPLLIEARLTTVRAAAGKGSARGRWGKRNIEADPVRPAATLEPGVAEADDGSPGSLPAGSDEITTKTARGASG